MIKCCDWPISVCTWSLDNDFDKLATLREQTQLNHLNLGLSPALESGGEKYLSRVQKEGWIVTATEVDFPQEDYSTLESIKASGGIVPEDCWEDNKKRVIDAIDITARMDVKYLMFHFGFLDHNDAEAYKRFREKVELLAGAAADKGVELLMETGQEGAGELREFLEELNHRALQVNFDPANMILYDKGDPIEAVGILGPWIKQVHVKDALRTEKPGSWGQEVPWGMGQVDDVKFLGALKEIKFEGALAIEREEGDSRLGDIKIAADALVKGV